MSGTNSRLTTAGRLLQAVAESGQIELAHVAGRLGTTRRRLEECRIGVRALNLETQILLAGMIAELSPDQARLAARLHGQAQAALRMRDGDVKTHSVYYQAHYWDRAR